MGPKYLSELALGFDRGSRFGDYKGVNLMSVAQVKQSLPFIGDAGGVNNSKGTRTST